jgi:hypothetical protein
MDNQDHLEKWDHLERVGVMVIRDPLENEEATLEHQLDDRDRRVTLVIVVSRVPRVQLV